MSLALYLGIMANNFQVRISTYAKIKGVFFGTIFPAIFVGSDTETYYRTGCECDSCILGNGYY